jgi:hypothetical protein
VANTALGVVAALLLAGTATAQQTVNALGGDTPVGNTLELSVGARYSDNVGRVEDGASGTTGTAGVLLLAERKSGTLQYQSNGDLDFIHYFNQNFKDEVLGQFTGTAAYSFVPQSFVWVTNEHFGQVTTDYFLAPGPQNRQYLNLFSTGPDLRLRLGGEMALRLSGRYGRDDYQTSPYSANRLSGEAALERRPSEATLVSLGGNHERVQYQEDVAKPGNFDVNRYFAGYRLNGLRTTIDLQGGYSQSSGGLAQLRGATGYALLERRVGSSGRLDLGVRRTLDTVGPGSRGTDFLPGVVNQPRAEVLTGSLYFSDSADLSYHWQRPRNTLDVTVGLYRETDHRDIRPDRDGQTVGAKFSHRLTPLAEAGVFATWSRDTLYDAIFPGFPQGDFRSTDSTFGVLLRLRFSRLLAVSADLTHEKRVADIGPFAETALWLRLVYAPLVTGAGQR